MNAERLQNWPATAEGAERAARQYLKLPRNERDALKPFLRDYRENIESVIEKLRPAPGQADTRRGEIRHQHFSAPGLRKKHPDDLLYFYVPEGYDHLKPFGLLIFMHGGDGDSPREKAGVVISRIEEDSASYGFRPIIEKASFITVAPSAPIQGDGKRWNIPEADDYISSVIHECTYRFNIDRDHIVLGGHSMGAFGSYHLGQRLNDRLAGVLFSAGAWQISDFRSLANTGVFIIHGRNDTAPGASPLKSQGTRRNAWTGVSFSRAASELMTRDGINHTYREHDGGHAFADGREGAVEFVRRVARWRRNPFPKHLVVSSPRGSGLINPIAPSPHSYWLTINKTGLGLIGCDSIELTGPDVAKNLEDLSLQGYRLARAVIPGGRVEATLKGGNMIDARAENVESFSIWLHPQMVDFMRPISIVVNGAKTEHKVQPSLLDALRSYDRRGDWGLIYHAELVMTVN